jgi:integrase
MRLNARECYANRYATMASIHKQPGKPYWFCSYSTWDAEQQRWRRHFKSTGTAEKKEAAQVCRAWEKAARVGRKGALTPDRAREIIATGVADVFSAATRENMPSRSVRDWCTAWIETKRIEAAPTTVDRYEGIIERFNRHLGKKADRDIASLTAADIGGFRDALAKELSRNSANLAVKTLRVCLRSAHKQGLVTSNAAGMVDKLKQRGETRRRPFTLAEIRRVLTAAGDSEWYGMTLAGLYCGARLADLARLTWRAVDLPNERLAFVAKKTGQRLSVPLAKPLADYLAELPASDSPDAQVFPKLSTKSASKLSEGFRSVLADAGLAEPPNKRSTGKGRHAAREVSELSFHSLRHSFVSILKSTGANEAVAMALAGHETKAISQQYTSLDESTLRAAVSKLPDVTKAA